MTSINFNVNFRRRLLLLLFTALVGFFLTSLLSTFVMYKFGGSTPAMRIVTIAQDLLVFIMPAVITAVMITRLPADLLCINKKIPWIHVVIAACIMCVSVPVMNCIIWLNEQCPLPNELAETLRQMEDNAASIIKVLEGQHTFGNLIMTILIVGVFTGFSEELLFRGALQRILHTGGLAPHIAIWSAALLFSVLHLQFYGLIPRMLLGAFFGYTLWWSGSLWVPIILHAFNNTIYVVAQWVTPVEENKSMLDTIGAGSDFIIVIASLLLTVIGISLLQRMRLNTQSD